MLLITAALGLSQRLVIQDKFPNIAQTFVLLKFRGWNFGSSAHTDARRLLRLLRGFPVFTAHAQMHGRKKLHVYRWFFSNWLSRFFFDSIRKELKKKTKNSTLHPQASLNWSRSQEGAGETGGPAIGTLLFFRGCRITKQPLCLKSHLSQCVQLLTPRGASFPFQHPVASWPPPQPASRWAGKGLFSICPKRRKLLVPRDWVFLSSFFLFFYCVYVCVYFSFCNQEANLPN